MMTIVNNSLASRCIKAALCAGVIALLAPSSIRAQTLYILEAGPDGLHGARTI